MMTIEMRPGSLIIVDLIAGFIFHFLLMPGALKGTKAISSGI